MTGSFSAESRRWGDHVWLPGALPWRLQQTWGGGDVRCSRLCKVIHNEKKKRQTILQYLRQSLILKPSGCLVLVRTIQSYLAPWAAKGSTIPLCRLAKFKILLEMKIHAHIYSCMAILCILFVWQFLTLKINFIVVKDQNFQFQNSYINSMGSHGQHTPHHLPTSY